MDNNQIPSEFMALEYLQPTPEVIEPQVAEEKPEVVEPKFNIDDFVKEKTGGKFEKWDDLDGFIKEPVKFENDDSRKMFNLILEGKTEDLESYFSQQKFLSNVDKMSDKDRIIAQMQIQDPEATEEELSIDFERKFGEVPDSELMDEDAYKKAIAKYNRVLKTEGKAASEFLGGLKKELKLPELPKNSFTANELGKEVETLMGAYSKALETNDFSNIALKIEDKQQGVALDFSYNVTDEDKADIKNTNYFSWFDTTYGQGDQINGKKLAEDMFKLKNFEQIVKSAALKAYNEGVLANINKQSNASVQPVVGRTTAPEQRVQEAEVDFRLR